VGERKIDGFNAIFVGLGIVGMMKPANGMARFDLEFTLKWL